MLMSSTRHEKTFPDPFVPVSRGPGYIVIDGEHFDDETDRDLVAIDDAVGSRRSELPSLIAKIYGMPHPIKVLRLARDKGFHAAVEMWSMRTAADIVQLICRGRRMEGSLKTVPQDEAERIVRRTAEVGCVSWTAKDLGIPASRIYAAHDQCGVHWPTLDRSQRSAATIKGLEAAGKGKGMTRGPRGAAVHVSATCH
jgi:hypothetical protein